MNRKVEFLNKFEYIETLTHHSKTKICYQLKEKSCILNQPVYQEGDSSDNIYLILSGQFEVTKDLFIDEKENQIGFRRMFTNKGNVLISYAYN